MTIHRDTALHAFGTYLKDKAGITDDVWRELESVLTVKEVRRNDWVLEEGSVCEYIDYVFTGALRSFYNKDGEEITVGLHAPNECCTQMKSLMNVEPSHLTIQAVVPGVIVRLRKKDMISLYSRVPEMEGVGRKILEHMLVLENDWKEMYALFNPEQRYSFMLQKTPEWVRIFPLQYIASFLGMRRETLSRIRSKIRV